MEKTSYTPGTFCWADLATTDTDAAKKFYGDLFGWSAADSEHEGTVVYTMFNKGEKHLAGMGKLQPEQIQNGVPPHWSAYIAVENVEATTEKITAAGGKVLMPVMDIFDAGRMAIFQDPTGVVFSVWQPGAHKGAQLHNEPGAFCFTEIYSHDPAATKKFYADVFGWTTREETITAGTYTMFCLGEEMIAGVIDCTAERFKQIPPHWGVYFRAADVEQTVAKVGELGGSTIHPPTAIGEFDRFAVLKDPQGAVFYIYDYNKPD